MADNKIWVGTDTPGDWGVAANWSPAGVPAATDHVFFLNSNQNVTAGLDQSLIAIGSLTIMQSYTGSIGVVSGNTLTYLQIDTTNSPQIDIGQNDGVSPGTVTGSPQLLIDLEADAAVVVNIHNSKQTATVTGFQPIMFVGGHAANVFNIRKGIVGIATANPTETALLATQNQSYIGNKDTDTQVTLGEGVTVATINKTGGKLLHQSAATTVDNKWGRYEKLGAGVLATVNNWATAKIGGTGAVTSLTTKGTGGLATLETTGIITAVTHQSGTLDTTSSNAARTITTFTLRPGTTALINTDAITLTNDISETGRHRLTVSNL